MAKDSVAREKKTKAEIEDLVVAALRSGSDGEPLQVEVTRADPALYGANWAATGIRGAEDWGEDAIRRMVTVLQGKFDVAW